MIDIHDAHNAAHTWTDFFIHIATIVLGLFIAVGLEQIVEHIHHHYQAEQARADLADELGNNRDVLRINIMQLHIHERNLRADLGVLDRFRTHSSAPGDRLLIFDILRIFSNVHWKNAEETGATAYLSPDERIAYGFDYLQQDRFNAEADEADSALEAAAAVLYDENTQLPQPRMNGAILFDDKFTHSESATEMEIAATSPSLDFSRLTPQQIDRLELGIQQTIAADGRLLSIAGIIQGRQESRLKQIAAYAPRPR